MNINEQLKKYWGLILVIALALALVLIAVFVFRPKSELIEVDNFPETPSTAIKLEYLTKTQLEDLGANPNIKAQIINHDPLVYKVIRDDSDIINDLREIEGFR